MQKTVVDYRTLREEAMALARANPDPSRDIQVSKAQYDALQLGGATYFRCTPNRNTIKRALTYQGRVFFIIVPARPL